MKRRNHDLKTNLKFMGIANLIFIGYLLLIFLNEPWSDIHFISSIIFIFLMVIVLFLYVSLPPIQRIGFNNKSFLIERKDKPVGIIDYQDIIELKSSKIASGIMTIRTEKGKMSIGPIEEGFRKRFIDAYSDYRLQRDPKKPLC